MPGGEHGHVVDDLGVGLGEQACLLGIRRGVAEMPGPRDIGALAVTADQIGVEGQQIALPHDARAAFLEPRVGARARRQDAGLAPLAVALDVLGMQDGPDLRLAHAGRRLPLHFVERPLAAMLGAAHGGDLVRALDQPGVLHDLLAALDLDAVGLQGDDPGNLHLVDRQAAVIATVPAQHLVDLIRKFARARLLCVARQEVEEARPLAHLADQRQVRGEMAAAVEVPQHHVAVGGDKGGARRIMGDPHVHVGAVRRIADVQRIE